MKKQAKRTPRHYDGIEPPTHHLRDLLPRTLKTLRHTHALRPDLLVQSWPEVVGPQVAGQTRAVSYTDGTLHVIVHNATLYSLLRQHEQQRLIATYRKQFPKVPITAIRFRMG